MREAVRKDDTNALAQHDIAFHRLIVEAAGNSVLEQCWKSLGVEGRITISLYGTYMDPGAGRRAPRQADRRDPLGQPERRRPRGAQARRGVGRLMRAGCDARSDGRACIARTAASLMLPLGDEPSHRDARRAVPRRADPAPPDRGRRPADPLDPGRISAPRMRSSGCSARSRCSAWACSPRSPPTSRPGSARAGR